MAIAGLSVSTGGTGKAVAHAAYIARTGPYEKLLEKGEVLEAAGQGNMPAWAEHDPSLFWQAADTCERVNGTTYRELLISLPRELDSDQRHALVKEFVSQEIGDVHAYQYAIHVPRASDRLDNPHVHLMFSERRVDGIDRDPDRYFKRYNAKSPEKGGARKGFGANPGAKLTRVERADELKSLRGRWEVAVNVALEKAGHSVRVNMKSYAARGLDIQPEPKQLPSAWRKEGRRSILEFRAARKAEMEARRDPSVIIDRVSSMKGLFTRADLYREVNKITDDVEVFAEIKMKLDVHSDLIPLETGREPGSSEEQLTTQRVLDSESSICALGDVLVGSGGFGLSEKTLDRVLVREPQLSDEQVSAVRHVSKAARLSMIAGVAGAGKSTTLAVVREGYETRGFRVSGVALAGKAADELELSSGIASRTIASWLYRHDRGEIELTKKDVLVIDEAGMVNNTTMERVLDVVNQAGAKVILVGDAEQLQPIQAGCPFRSLSDDHGVAEITTVRRQKTRWQREATQALSRGQGGSALSAYREKGCVHDGAEDALVAKVVENYLSRPKTSAVILAHRNVDVAMLNAAVRDERKARGELANVKQIGAIGLELGVGDRVVFTRNDAGLGVKNGQFGEVVSVGLLGASVGVRLDSGRSVEFSPAHYSDVVHGYASTIHKSQGMTVDRAMVWGSASLDRHLGYVAMSRHRERLDVYQPIEATRVRSLDRCLSRSTRAVTVDAVIRQHGLGLEQRPDGRVRLSAQYPGAALVDQAKAIRVEATRHVSAFVEQRTNDLMRDARAAADALAVHQNSEPPGRRKRDVLMPGANQRWVDWTGREAALKVDVQKSDTALGQWRYALDRQDEQQRLVSERVNSVQRDLLSVEGGVERTAEGKIVITDRYPSIARDEARRAARSAQEQARSHVSGERRGHVDRLAFATSRFEHHLNNEPTDSALRVFLYQGPKGARDVWDAKLLEIKAELQDADAVLHRWEQSIEDGTVEKNLAWNAFSASAPDASRVNAQILKAEQGRAEFAQDVRDYYRVEKSLEAKLGRSLKTKEAQKRDQLLNKLGRASNQKRLPARLKQQATQHRESVSKAKALKRSLSRGHGLGR